MSSDAALEIAIYLHRFHNLDLFQQGWYALKVTSKWEGFDHNWGSPTRVVQYEAPDGSTDDSTMPWHINDAEHSFSTRPFKIKYARQDVFLGIMVSFTLPVQDIKAAFAAAALIKFQLTFIPIDGSLFSSGNQSELPTVASHEFRIPPKASLGLHSYCPVYFDTWHMALVDVTVHTVMLSLAHYEIPTHSSRCYEDEALDQSGQKVVQVSEDNANDHIYTFRNLLQISKSILAAQKDILGLSACEDIEGMLQKHQIADTQEGISQSGGEPILKNVLSNETFLEIEGNSESETKADVFIMSKSLSDEISLQWNIFLRLHRVNRESVLEHLRGAWAQQRALECSMWVVHTRPPLTTLELEADVRVRRKGSKKANEEPGAHSALRAEICRRSLTQSQINGCSLQDMQIFGNPSLQPFVSAEHYVVPGNSEDLPSSRADGAALRVVIKETSGMHQSRPLRVVVFVHGFQGHHLDLRLVRNHWILMDPEIEFLMSEANEDRTMSDFRELGQRLAEEVAQFLKNKMNKVMRQGVCKRCSLSFVGHSIGNLIIRAALLENAMKPYLQFLHTFLSVSGPHLGYLYSSNLLFNSGLWVLKKLKASPCMHQLTFTDKPDIEDCFLFKMSQAKTFHYFQHVLLLSSPQDRYVPYHSARIEICEAALRDSRKGSAYISMVRNCMEQLTTRAAVDRSFIRCDVNFDLSSQARTLNNFIGRTAHIEFLETDAFIRFIFWTFPDCFT